MEANFLFDVFLSHNSADKPRVRQIAERLRVAGARVWFDEWSIKYGEDIYLKIEEGLQKSRVLVLCLSQAALNSNWVALERGTVLFRDPTNKHRRFIPIKLSECDLPDTIRRYKFVDYRRSTEQSFQELLTACDIKATNKIPANVSGHSPSRSNEGPSEPPPIAAETRIRDGIEKLATLKGHTDHLHTLAWSPDGKLLASASQDGTARLWLPFSNRPGRVFRQGKEEVWHLSWSPDSSQIISTALLAAPQLWSPTESRRSFKLITDAVVSEWSPSGQWVFIGDRDGKVWRIDLRTQQISTFVEATGSPVNCIAWSPDEEKLAISRMSGEFAVFHAQTGKQLLVLYSETVWSLLWSNDGKYLFSGSKDKTIRIWEAESGRHLHILEGHTEGVSGLSLSAKHGLLASYSSRELQFWNTATWRLVSITPRDSSSCLMTKIAFNPEGELLATPGADNTIEILAIHPEALPLKSAVAVRTYVNAKVALVGESGVGKTTLAHRLVQDQFVATESTHGMKVWKLDLPVEKSDYVEREALLWDFAGQPDYRLVHQLYFEETALALLLINPQKNDPFAESIDWLKALESAGSYEGSDRKIAKLLIPTRVDVGGMTISDRKIDRFVKEHDFLDCIPVSAKRGDNCSDSQNSGRPSKLKEAIARSIPWDEMPSTFTPRLLAKMKDTVVAMRDDEEIRLLRFSELNQRIEQEMPEERFGEGIVRTAVTLLANQGLVRPLRFGDLIVLRPDILNSYASAIIRAARTHKDEIGCITEESIYSEGFDFFGVDRLISRADEELLLRALVQTLLDHSLCIREVENGATLLIFPSQYRRDREIPRHPEIFISYTFTGELQTIYTTLVVRAWYSRIFDQRELWRNAAEFATTKGQIVGVIFQPLGDGVGKLSVFFDAGVPDELKVIFIEFVQRHLDKYARGLQRQRRYVCKDCGQAVDNAAMIRKRLEAGRDFITCQNCDARVIFFDHVEERLASTPIARQVTKLEAREKFERDEQSVEQGVIGHVMTICADANQQFRALNGSRDGIDGEILFRSDSGSFDGKKIYIQLRFGNTFENVRIRGGKIRFDVRTEAHLGQWIRLRTDVYSVLLLQDESLGDRIYWMNMSDYFKRSNARKKVLFKGEKLDLNSVWRVRDQLFPVSPRIP